MKSRPLFACVSLLLAFTVCLCLASSAAAQVPASVGVEFVAHVQPTDGQLEPARELPFFLLRKSLAEIHAEAERAEAPTNLDGFIDSLNASPALKAWMKAHQRIDLAGTDFTKQLSADDVVDVPEFLAAYNVQNGAALSVDLPEPKPKAGDKPGDREKYQHQIEQYRLALKRYIHANLDSLDGLDADLGDQNPARRWMQLQNEQQGRIESRTLKLAQTQYLAARTTSDLNGRGEFTGIAPGEYWLSTLDTPAIAGDLRLRWDVNLNVRSGQTTRVDLSNLNAVDPPVSAAR